MAFGPPNGLRNALAPMQQQRGGPPGTPNPQGGGGGYTGYGGAGGIPPVTAGPFHGGMTGGVGGPQGWSPGGGGGPVGQFGGGQPTFGANPPTAGGIQPGMGGQFGGGGLQQGGDPVYAARRAAAGVGGHIFDHGQLMSLAQIQAQHMPGTQPPGGGQATFGGNPPQMGGSMQPGGNGGMVGQFGGGQPTFGANPPTAGGIFPGMGGAYGGQQGISPLGGGNTSQPGAQFASNPHLQQLMQRLQAGGSPAQSPGAPPAQ